MAAPRPRWRIVLVVAGVLLIMALGLYVGLRSRESGDPASAEGLGRDRAQPIGRPLQVLARR